ncbi:MAG: hypothetical protein ACYCSO_09195 [Cuniculiplasma sp.]
MAEKTIGKKNGKIHFEIDVELPELRESALDILAMIKSATEEMVDLGKKIVSKTNEEPKEIKKINIK